MKQSILYAILFWLKRSICEDTPFYTYAKNDIVHAKSVEKRWKPFIVTIIVAKFIKFAIKIFYERR